MSYGPTRAAVLRHWKRWAKGLGICALGTTIEHRFSDIGRDDEDGSVVATTNALWQYRTAALCWYLPTLAALTDAEIEDVVVHEMCHVLLAPMEARLQEGSDDHREFTVETLARALKHLVGG